MNVASIFDMGNERCFNLPLKKLVHIELTEPRMTQNFINILHLAKSVLSVLIKHLCDEILSFWANLNAVTLFIGPPYGRVCY